MVVMRDFTAAASTSAIGGRIAPISTSRSRESFDFENLRIETSGPSTPIGRTAQLKREPSRRRASHKGLDSSTRRPTAETIFWMMRIRCASSLNSDGTGSSTPRRSTKMFWWPFDQDVGDRRILEQGFERAETRHLVHDLGDEEVELPGVEGEALGDDPLGDDAVDLAAQLVGRQLLERGEVELLDQAPVQAHLGVQQLLVRRGGRRRHGGDGGGRGAFWAPGGGPGGPRGGRPG